MTPSVFYNPEDQAAERASVSALNLAATPAIKRARAATAAAVLILRNTPKANDNRRLKRMREYVLGLRLPPSRLALLWTNTRDSALLIRQGADDLEAPSFLPDVTRGEYMAAAWLASRAALMVAVDVPLPAEGDAAELLEMVTASPGVLPAAYQRKALAIGRRYLAARISGKEW